MAPPSHSRLASVPRVGGAPGTAERLYHHYELLQATHPGPLLDRLYLRLARPVGVVAPPRPRSSVEVPNFDQVPLDSLDEAVRSAMRTTAGIEALEAFARTAGKPGDHISIVRRAVALRAAGKLTREVGALAYSIYLREKKRRPELEKLVAWLL
ncbi:MAG: hypothetical protein QXO51_08520 [Halobacteria archaeon]